MKNLVILLILCLGLITMGKGQCPVTSPIPNLNNLDANSPNCDAGSYRYVGSMTRNGGGTCFQQTAPNSCGIAYYGSTYSITCGFCVTFNLTLAPGITDGIAFTMADFSQTSSGNPCSSPLDACGIGGNLGYNTFTNSSSNLNGGGALTIEFDTFSNAADDDPACDHVSIVEDGDNTFSEAQACTNPSNLNDGLSHAVAICWDPGINRLTVEIDGNTIITYNNDISTYFSGTNLHFAFSGGTGGSFSGTNSVCNWNVIPFGTPLDANGMNLSGRSKDGKVLLEWMPEENPGSNYFVQRSNGGDFVTIGQVNSHEGKTLERFLDDFPEKGINIYRIEKQDEMGNLLYSNSIEIQLEESPAFSISRDRNLLIAESISGESFRVSLSDLRGREIRRAQVRGHWETDVTQLPTGIYILRMHSQTSSYAQKILLTGN